MSAQMLAELSHATRMIPLEGGDLKVITLVGDEQKVYFVERKDVAAFFAQMEQVYAERRKNDNLPLYSA